MSGSGRHHVFVDANVWYSRALRDWIGVLYTQPEQAPFIVHWSEDILGELVYHLRRKHPDWDGGKISTIRDRIAGTFEIGRVKDFEIQALDGVVDPHDRHVHGAALACGADILLTFNVRDFLGVDQYDVMTPDEFLVLVDDAAPRVVRSATAEQAAYWGRRRGEVDLPERLRSAGCPGFAARVLAHLRAAAMSSG